MVYIAPGEPIDTYRGVLSRIRAKQADLEDSGWKVMVMGDLNAHVGCGTGGIPGNHEKVDSRGKEIHKWITDTGSILLNSHENCNGLWTWNRGDKVSVVDYMVTSGSLEADIEELYIDDAGDFDVGSDHNWLWLRVKYQRHQKAPVYKPPRWDINADTDWKMFRQSLEEAAGAWIPPAAETGETDDDVAEKMVAALNDLLSVVGQRTVGMKESQHAKWGDNGLSREAHNMIERRKAACRAHKRAKRLKQSREEVELRGREYQELKRAAEEVKLADKAKRANKMLKVAQRDRSLNTLWAEVKHLRKGPGAAVSLKSKEGRRLTTRQEVAEELAKHADALFNGAQNTTAPESTDERPDQGTDALTEPFDIDELNSGIKRLKRGKAVGADMIPNEFLKESGPVFRMKLLEVLNRILQMETIPEVWRTSRLCMIPKKGDLSLLDNYRGIAINSNIGKLFTKLLGARLEADVELRQILGKIQHGFRRGIQAADALYILNRIMAHQGQRPGLAMAFLDIRKAYDRVNREKLWAKLEKLGYGGKLVRVLKALYQDLTTVVTLDDVTSEPVSMSQGLKQGCCLSPLLFALYISDLGQALEESGKGYSLNGLVIPGLFFADDMALVAKSEKELQELLDMTGEFGREMDLEFSGEKSVVMVSGRDADKGRLWYIGQHQVTESTGYEISPPDDGWDDIPHVEDEVIVECEMGPSMHETEEFKYLGQWAQVLKPRNEELVDKMVSRARKLKGEVIQLAKESFSFAYVARILWEKVAMPSLLYGCETVELSEGDLFPVEKVQREMARIVTGGLNSTSIQGMYAELNWRGVYVQEAERRLGYLYRLLHVSGQWRCKAVFDRLGGVHSQDGWMSQVKDDLKYLSLQLDRVGTLSKKEWRQVVVRAVRVKGISQFQEAAESLPSLRYLRLKTEPAAEDYITGTVGAKLLFQARTGQMECTGSRHARIGHSGESCARCNPEAWIRRCDYCGRQGKDDVQHLVLECTLHEDQRATLFNGVGWEGEGFAEMNEVEQMQWVLGISTESNIDLSKVQTFLKKAAKAREQIDKSHGVGT